MGSSWRVIEFDQAASIVKKNKLKVEESSWDLWERNRGRKTLLKAWTPDQFGLKRQIQMSDHIPPRISVTFGIYPDQSYLVFS